MQDDLFTIELLVDKHVQVVLFLLYVDWYINTSAVDRDWDRLRVVLVLKEESEPLWDFGELHWDESKLDLGAAVTVNLSRAFEADLGQKLIENVSVCRNVVILYSLIINSMEHGWINGLSTTQVSG